jgi:hypothetical protein
VFFNPGFSCLLAARYTKSGFTGVKNYFGGVAFEA